MRWASRLFQSAIFGKTQSSSSRRSTTRLRIDTLESRDVPSVTGVVFHDADDNAVQGTGEEGLAGVTVELLGESGDTALFTTTTDSNGGYSFAQATSGNYRVRIPASNFVGSGALHHYAYGDNNTDPVVSEPVAFDDAVNFGMTQTSDPNHGDEETTGTVSGKLFHDADDDGTQDSGEEGLSGVTIELLGETGDTALQTTTTGSDGSYSFDELEEGNYRIRITADNFTGSGALHHYSYQNNNAAAVTSAAIALNGTANFGLHQDSDPDHGDEGDDDNLLSIGDTVFVDYDNDGMIDDGETGIAGVKVELLGETGDTPLKTATTDSNGKYLFTGLAAGNYRVRIAADNFTGSGVLVDYTSSKGTDQAPDPNNDNDNDDNGTPASDGSVISGTITLTVGGEPDGDQDANSNLSIDFGFVPPVEDTALLTLGDQVFRDLDNDGQLDDGEVGIAGVAVDLLDSNGNVLKSTTTDSTGHYSFTGLTPGTYKVRLAESNFKDSGPLVGFTSSTGTSSAYEGTNTPDPNNNTDNEDNGTTTGTLGQAGGYIESKPITLAINGEPQGNTNNTLDFGVVPSGTIKLSLGDTVWNDVNNNGTLDSGESGIAGVVVQLLNSTGTVIQTQTTDANGKYLFTDLLAGDYRVRLAASNFKTGQVLAGYTASSGTAADPDNNTDNDNNGTVSGTLGGTGTIDSAAITLTIGAEPDVDVNKTLDFGLFRGYSIGNQVWNDLNNNGVKDAGEKGIEGVVVRLLRFSDMSVIATATTNAQGLYLLQNVPQGEYVVELAASNFKAGGALYSFKSSTGTNNAFEGSTIPDANVILTDGDDNGTTNGTLGSDGVIRTLPVRLGPDATEPTGETPNNDPDTADNRSNLTVDFGVYQETPALASLEGRVFLDYNNNGKFDAADKGIEGVTITLSGGGLTDALTVTTDADGKYKFTNLKAGTYTITETQPTTPANQTGKDVAGSLGGDASTANTIKSIVLGENKIGTGYNFGEIPVVTLSGSVFDDANGNGVKDSGETGISGVTVTLTGTNVSGTTITPVTATTDADGNYKFENLTPGKYNIKETQPTGYLDGKEQNGTPKAKTVANDEFKGIDLTSTNATATGFNFGEVKAGSFKGAVFTDADNDGLRDDGEAGIAGVKIKLVGTNDLGKKVTLTTTTGDDGTFAFNDLRPGKYTIIETQPAKYKDGKETTGTAIGVTTTNDQIQNITLGSGVNATGYSFAEQAASDLIVKQVISSARTTANGNIVVNYTITNKGSLKAAAAAVTLNFGGMQFVSSNGGTSYDKLTKTWNVGDLETGQTKTLRVVLRSTGAAVYKITAKAASTTVDLKAANNEVSDLIYSGFRASLRTSPASPYASGPAVTPAPTPTGPAPTTPTLTLADASDTGTKGDDRTDTEVVDLEGTTSPNTRVTLVEKNLSVSSDSEGNYTFEDVTLAQGVNSFTVKATSANGKSSQTTKSIVRNSTPTASTQIGAQSLATGASSTLDLAGYFTDADLSHTKIKISTSAGDINVELFDKEAPRTVANFLNYIDDGDYDDSIFHRSVAGFVLQGGGYTFSTDGTAHLEDVPEDPTVQNEPDTTNRSNLKGTLAMAKLGSDPNSATSQFFFNLGNNASNLDNQNGGFTVFGKLVGDADQAVVDALAAITTKDMTNAADLPADQKTVFEDIPLKDYTGTDFPTDTTAANYAMINGVSIVSQTEKLTYSIVSNSDSTAVTAAIVDNRLTLTGGSTAGSSTITIRATDMSGATVDMTFTVTVAAATT